MKINSQKIITVLMVASVSLISIAIFFKFLVEPIYNKYSLSSCLADIENFIDKAKKEECKSVKDIDLRSCLLDAQKEIYCRDGKNTTYIKKNPQNIFSGYEICNAPNNANGYWDDNTEYWEFTKQCETKISEESCNLDSSFRNSINNYREEERDFCFKKF